MGHGSTEKEDERDGEREKRFRAEGDAAGCRQRSEEEGCFSVATSPMDMWKDGKRRQVGPPSHTLLRRRGQQPC